jgi:hypothetical protein
VGNGVYRTKLKDVDAAVAIEISPDGLEARIASYRAPVGNGKQLTRGMLAQAFARAGVEVEPDAEAVAQVFERTEKGLDVQGIVIARGIPPRNGRGGRFEFAGETGGPAGSSPGAGGQDFYERDTVASVTAGSLIGRIVPPEKGVPGRSVCGHSIPAEDGPPFHVAPGPNVTVSDDGLEFHTKITGAVILSEDVLSVVVAFEIPGDVDFVRGGVRVRHASVVVQGTVRSGLSVVSGGGISVAESVENSVIEAAGDVLVRRGIAMSGSGRIRSGGSVFCHFAENAVIEANGDVVVDNDISNCDIRAHGRIIAIKGKGRIQGGVVRCDGGVEANEIGSPLGVATRVVVGLEGEEHEALAFEREELERTLQKIRAFLGGGDPVTILQRTGIEKRESVAELLKTATAARRRLEEIETALRVEGCLLRSSSQATIKVRDVVYPGTLLTIVGRTFRVHEPIHKSRFYYDRQSDSVQVGSVLE